MEVSRPLMLDVLETENRIKVNSALALYKTNGQLNHKMILSIPSSQRIPELIKQPEGRARVAAALSGAIFSAFSALNLRLGMNEDQIVDLADEIIDSSHEDYLSIEDILLFLKELITGKAGVINDRMDTPTFFKFFEVYRQERHDQLMRIKEEQQAQYKSAGDSTRLSDDNKEKERNAFHEAMKTYYKGENH